MSTNAVVAFAAAAPDAALWTAAQSVRLDWRRLAGYAARFGEMG